jgi:hypothetical protein
MIKFVALLITHTFNYINEKLNEIDVFSKNYLTRLWYDIRTAHNILILLAYTAKKNSLHTH